MSTSTPTETEVVEQPAARDTRLRVWNAVMAVLHFLQGLVMVALAAGRHVGGVYELGGPERLTVAETVEIVCGHRTVLPVPAGLGSAG